MRILFAFALLALAGVACAEFDIAGLREFDTTSVSSYPEIGEMKQNIMLSYYSQGRSSLPQGFEGFSDSSLDFMEKFANAYNISSNGGSEELLKLPGAIGETAGALRNAEAHASESIPLSKYSAYLARYALERYVEEQAERLKALAEAEARTSQKLNYYEAAVGVFSYSEGGVGAAEVSATYESVKAGYEEDITWADSVFVEQDSLCRSSVEQSSEWFGIPSYAGLRRCTGGLTDARKIYAAHLELEKLSELDRKLDSAREAEDTLTGSVQWFFLYLLASLLLINVLIVSRVREWLSDDYDSSLGSEVLRWKGR